MSNGNVFQNVAPWLKAAGTVAGAFNPVVGAGITGLGTAMGGFQAEQQKQAELATTAELQKTKDRLIADYNAGKISAETYDAAMKDIQGRVKDLDQSQKDYQSDLNAFKGTEAGSALLGGLTKNALERQAAQQQAADYLTSETAATPLQQYRKDADVKRQMALNTQQNLANNVANQLNALTQSRAQNTQLLGQMFNR